MGERWGLRVETVEDAHYGPMRSCVLYDHDATVCYVGHSEDGKAALRELVDAANERDRLAQGIRHAPHFGSAFSSRNPVCNWLLSYPDGHCDCWKAALLDSDGEVSRG